MKILCVGKICLDIINYLDSYPVEDSDQSIPSQRWAQGGNASNNCVVFDQLRKSMIDTAGSKKSESKSTPFEFELFGTFGRDLASDFVRNLLSMEHGIDLTRCPNLEGDAGGLLSTSCVLINRSNGGTRTIIHARNGIRDANFDDFRRASFDFGDYDWIQFENRESAETKKMVDLVLEKRGLHNPKPIISVEIEKDKPHWDSLIKTDGIDYVFVSKDLARSRNCEDIDQALAYFSSMVADRSRTTVVCPWGDRGAGAIGGRAEGAIKCPAVATDQAEDTLGAGDTFIASFIFARGQLGRSIDRSLAFACEVAGLKCSIIGYDRLNELIRNRVVKIDQ